MPSLKLTWNSKALSVSPALNGTLLMLRWVQACCSPRLITGPLLAGWMAAQEPILGRLAARWGRMTCLFVFNYRRGSLKMFPWLSISYRVAERQRVRTGRVTTEAPTTPPKKLEPQCCSWSQEATTSAPSQVRAETMAFFYPLFYSYGIVLMEIEKKKKIESNLFRTLKALQISSSEPWLSSHLRRTLQAFGCSVFRISCFG